MEVRTAEVTEEIREFDPKDWKSNRKGVNCSVDTEEVRAKEPRPDKRGKNPLPQLAAREQPQMSRVSPISHPSLPPPIHPSSCLTFPRSHFPDELASIFFYSLFPRTFVPTMFCFIFPFPLLPSHCSFPVYLSVSPPLPSPGCPEASDGC